ncbi:MAG TPA: BPSS1780 family membrane protein [Usitatibacter sp.]|nr:BPSS1780 family membrane protein [Usitatibacter sp.]
MSASPDRDNPFAPPRAAVLEAASPLAGELVAEGQKVAASRGVAWLAEGWEGFLRAPGMWLATCLVFGVIWIVLSFLPLLNLVSGILGPVFLGGIMLGCDKLRQGHALELSDLFSGFQRNAGGLLLVGLLYLVGWFLIMAFVGIGMAVVVGVAFSPNDLRGLVTAGPAILLIALVAVGLSMPLIMAIWFAPALVVFHELQATAAMRASFSGCLRNMGPFLLYGLVSLVAAIVAILPVGLGLLVLFPVIWGSMYAGYRDIFVRAG